MAGLLSDVLPFLYSQGDRAKRHVRNLLSDPIGSLEQTAGGVQDSHRAQLGLLAQAFPDQQRPFKVVDEAALAQATQNMMAGPLGFAPAGMVKSAQASVLPSQAEKMAAVGYEGGWFRGGPKIDNGKMSGPWYTKHQDEAADYARRFGGSSEVREYAIPAKNMLNANMSYSSRLAYDLADKVKNEKAAKLLRSYMPNERVNGVEIWQGLKNNIGEDDAINALRSLGFGGVKGINSPDYARLFPGTVARDAKMAAFDPAKIKAGVDDIYGRATPEMMAAIAAAGGLGLAGLRYSRGDE